jgi:secondary thiamine-phosphate synthase enzyme
MPVEIEVQTRAPQDLVEITDQIEQRVRASGIREGMCFVYCPHTTAGLTINENADPDVRHDMLHAIDQLVALRDPAYRHAEGNSAAHVKASLMGFSLWVPVLDRRPALGRWQGVYLCEFDGPRRRRVTLVVQSMG